MVWAGAFTEYAEQPTCFAFLKDFQDVVELQ
jgi:hypothetical protein